MTPVRGALLAAACVIALGGCMNRSEGQRPEDYRTMSCDELMSRLAAFDETVEDAMAEAAKHAQGTQAQQAVRRRLRETSKDIVRELSKRCPVMVEPRLL
ncbi:MAG: hypothetical protein F4029_15765 [Gammaproteobacteria bacterium]|nr:hypothetical protein [Gammaproteobacteria bacterium]MYK47674.1 hypothetical protein [Gammaproteobacteria bacterium]